MIDTKEHILRTAFRLFITKSYKAVTMCDLEKATGLTKGAFYHYFKNKEEIYIEVIDKFYISNQIPRNIDVEENGTLRDYIDLHLNHIEFLASKLKEIAKIDRPDTTLVSLILEAKEYYPGFAEKLKEMGDSFFNKWERTITRAKLKGEILEDIESDILTENFIAIGFSIFRYILNGRSIEFAYSMVKLQYNQLYKLVKK
jgi:TetR/AcrR family transcriptional regulator, transcriptional repressor for nem operon